MIYQYNYTIHLMNGSNINKVGFGNQCDLAKNKFSYTIGFKEVKESEIEKISIDVVAIWKIK